MKKLKSKIVTFVLALCLIIPFAVILTACGEDDPPQPTVQSSKAKVLNVDYAYSESGDCLTFLLTDIINFQKSDFEIVQTYTDNTTKTLESDKWLLDLSEVPTEPESIYEYRVVFRYADNNEEIDYINLKFTTSQIGEIDFGDLYSTTYTGEEVDVVDMIDEYLLSQQKPTLTFLIQSGAVRVSGNDGNDDFRRSATNAGSYIFAISTNNGYEWSTGDTSDKFVYWNINKVLIPCPTLVSDSLEYDYEVVDGEPIGVVQNVEYSFGNFQNPLQYIDINRDTQGFERFQASATNVGQYTIRFDIKEDCVQNFEFESAPNITSYDLDWKITPVRVTIPSLKEDEFTYNPNGFNPIELSNLNNYNSALMTLTNYADAIPQVNGSNYVDVALKDLNNFLWDYESGTRESQILYFTVNKANVQLPNDFDESKLKMVATWSSYLPLNSLVLTLQDSVADFSAWTTEAREYMLANGFGEYHSLEWASNLSSVDLTQVGAGTYVYKMIYCPDTANYNTKELNVTVEVLKERLSINYYLLGDDSLSPENRVYTARALDITMESMTEQINIENYSTNVTYSIGYKKTQNGEYVYSDYTQAQFDSINGDLGRLMLNAGYYDLKVSVTADGNHLFYDTYKSDSTATQVCVLHQPVVIHPHEVTMWVSFNHNLDIDYYNHSIYENHKFYYKEGQSISYEIDNFSDSADKTTLIYTQLNTTTLVSNTLDNLPTCVTKYRASESDEWVVATNTTDIGYYKNVYTFTSIDADNIVVNPFEVTWEVIPANVNFDRLSFIDFDNPIYSGDSVSLPTINDEHIPSSVIKSGYTYKTGTGYSEELYGWQIKDAGNYLTSWWFKVPNNVTVTYCNNAPSESLFTTTTDGDYTTYNFNVIWAVEKYSLTDGEVDFDTYTNNQTLEYTGEELAPEYEVVFIEDFTQEFKNKFTISKTTKQNDTDTTPIEVGEYETTIIVKIRKDNITLDETYEALLEGLTEDDDYYYITRIINWSITSTNA